MSFGQSFGAFGQGLSNGYQVANRAKEAKFSRQEEPQEPSAIDGLIQRITAGRLSDSAVAEQDAITQESNSRTWDLIRSMEDGSYGLDQSYQAEQQSSGGMQLDPSMIKNFTGGGQSGGLGGGMGGGMGSSLSLGGAGGGLGGSGLIGSSGGAVSAGANGGASFGLGGSLVGGSGTVGGSTFAASSGAGSAGGAAAGSGAGGLAAAGPWAALAAIIAINEEDSRKKGLRAENRGERIQDMITGKVLTQDIEGKWGPKLDKMTGGKASEWGFTGDMKGASQIASFRFGKGLKTLWNDGTIGKIRDIF